MTVNIYIFRMYSTDALYCSFYFQLIVCIITQAAARLLGLKINRIILLDNKTKVLTKCQNTRDLIQVIYRSIIVLLLKLLLLLILLN